MQKKSMNKIEREKKNRCLYSVSEEICTKTFMCSVLMSLRELKDANAIFPIT